jgi:hypothetical protein
VHTFTGGLLVNRTRALILSLAAGLAAVSGLFALGSTVTLGQQARASNDAQIARRAAQLDRYEASLRKALAQKPPALPPVPSAGNASSVQSAAPVRVIYHRPPPVVVVTNRAGEHEQEGDEADD